MRDKIVGYVVIWDNIVLKAHRTYGLTNPDGAPVTMFRSRAKAAAAIRKAARHWGDSSEDYHIRAVSR